MGRLFKLVLIWLVALAVPAQGMAAAVMTHCGPAHGGLQATQPNRLALSALSQVAHAEHAAHGHGSHLAPDAVAGSDTGHSATSADGSDSAQADQGADPSKDVKATYKKCSACACCCGGLALPSTAFMMPTIDAAYEVTGLSLSEAASVVIDGPERPPRILRV